MNEKFTTFLEIATALNKENITPTISGSLGVFRIIGQLDEIGDIDIIIPNKNLVDEFENLVKIMKKIGYKQDKDFPHEFSKGKGQIGFEPESDLEELKINNRKSKITTINGIKFKELSPKDYLLIYSRNLKTWKLKVKKIEKKIKALKDYR
jgi:phosphoribosylanthranilate isomerase